MSIEKRMRRKADIRHRTSLTPHEPSGKCMALGCKRPTQRAERKGLSEMYCKRHVEFKRRHGSAWRKSYSAAELKPIRDVVRQWLSDNARDKWVVRTIDSLENRLHAAGPSVLTAWDWAGAGMDSRQRAFEVLARVRDAGMTGAYLLEAVLTAKVAGRVLPSPRGDSDFTNTQIAKLIHRKASGTHSTISKYPRAEGGFMRVLGEIVAAKCEDVADPETLKEITALVGAGNSR